MGGQRVGWAKALCAVPTITSKGIYWWARFALPTYSASSPGEHRRFVLQHRCDGIDQPRGGGID
jgi:hypothetical protein